MHIVSNRRDDSKVERKQISEGIEFFDKYLVFLSRDKK